MKNEAQGKRPGARQRLPLLAWGVLGIGLLGCPQSAPNPRASSNPADFFSPIRSIDAEDADFSDLGSLERALAGVEVVLLGEPLHGSNTGVAARARLVRFLHARLGFSILAYEASFYGTTRAWEDAQTAEDPATVLANGVHGGWSKRHGAPLFRYLAAQMKGDRPLRLAGVDPAFINGGTPEKALRFVSEAVSYLGARGCAASWTGPVRASLRELAELREEATAQQRAQLAPVQRALRATSSCLASVPAGSASPEDDFWRQVFVQVEALARYRWSDPDDPEIPRIRDRAMADNVAWLRAHHPGEKIIVWAANLHNARTLADVRYGEELANPGEHPMGQYLAESLGDRLFSLMTTSGEYAWRSGQREHCIPADRRDVFEAALQDRGLPAGWVNLRAWKRGSGRPGDFVALAFGMLPRRAPWVDLADGFLYLPVIDETSPRT